MPSKPALQDDRARKLKPLVRAGFTPIPLHSWNTRRKVLRDGEPVMGKDGKPLRRELGKAPRDANWTTREYDADYVITRCLKEGWNIGVRIPDSWVVIDIDPRSGGDDGFANLCEDFGLDPDAWPCQRTGSGGRHYFLRKPEGVKLLDTLRHVDDPDEPEEFNPRRYGGVEFKSAGRQVVAPGSIHPNGTAYKWERDNLADAPELPADLFEAATRPVHDASDGGGHIANDRLAAALEGLNPEDFRDHDEWLQLMMACHHATGGEGRQEFIEFSTQDPEYADHAEDIGRRWDSLHADRDDGVTVASLNRHLVKADRKDLLLPTEAAADAFGDDIPFSDTPADGDDEAPRDDKPTGKRFGAYDGLEFEGFPEPIPGDELFDGEINEPTYIVPDLVLDCDATAYYANGGLGKTTKAEQLACAIAAGLKTWLGEPVKVGPAPVMIMSGESESDEVKYRLRNIMEGTPKLRDLTRESLLRRNVFTYPLFSETPCLIVVDGKRVKPSPAFHWLDAQMAARKPRLVILDSLYNFYSEDESDKPLVHQFVMMVRRLAKKHLCAIVLIGHPSLTGIETGRGTSGATTWYNAFRGWIFETADEPKPGKRRTHKLEGKKAQYGAPGKVVECYWHNGCYKALTEDEREDRAEACKAKFVEMLAKSVKEGDSLNSTTGTGKSAYIVFGKDADNNDGFGKDDFLKAMKELLAEGRIGMRPYTRSNRTGGVRLEPIGETTEFG